MSAIHGRQKQKGTPRHAVRPSFLQRPIFD
jgi:hypothetical protein